MLEAELVESIEVEDLELDKEKLNVEDDEFIFLE